MIQNLLRVEKYVDSPTEKLKVMREAQNQADGDLILKAHKPHISVRNLNVYLAKNHILKNVSLDIPDKAITCIIGPSGCGKTTLLKTFNRLLQNSLDVKIDGDVLVDGENIHGKDVEVENIRKKMGLLSQRPCPLPMSIFDNIAYGPRIHGIRRKKTLKIMVERYLTEAGLWDEVKDRLKSPATSLSIGQQQRLCLARGLAVKPEIILGDEATSALDPISSKKIEELFVKLRDQYSIVLVLSVAARFYSRKFSKNKI